MSRTPSLSVAFVVAAEAQSGEFELMEDLGFSVTPLLADVAAEEGGRVVQPSLFGPERDGIEAVVREADLVWLAPSATEAFAREVVEVAAAQDVPVFSPRLRTIQGVRVVSSPEELRSVDMMAVLDAAHGLGDLQEYYKKVAVERGWASEGAQETLLLLIEEMGELARVIRSSIGLARDHEFPVAEIADEVADVQLYVVHLANGLGIDLKAAVIRKERRNALRHDERSRRST